MDNITSSGDFPHTIKKVEEKLNNKIIKSVTAYPDGFVHVGPEKWLLPLSYVDCAEKIYKFEVRSDDVFTCTYPRSGTTWTQEMIWLICNDFDYETALKLALNERFPYLE